MDDGRRIGPGKMVEAADIAGGDHVGLQRAMLPSLRARKLRRRSPAAGWSSFPPSRSRDGLREWRAPRTRRREQRFAPASFSPFCSEQAPARQRARPRSARRSPASPDRENPASSPRRPRARGSPDRIVQEQMREILQMRRAAGRGDQHAVERRPPRSNASMARRAQSFASSLRPR